MTIYDLGEDGDNWLVCGVVPERDEVLAAVERHLRAQLSADDPALADTIAALPGASTTYRPDWYFQPMPQVDGQLRTAADHPLPELIEGTWVRL